MLKTSRPTAFSRMLFLINLVFAISLVFCYSCAYISPAQFWPLAFFGLAYPLIFLINLLFAVFWMVRRRKYFLYTLVLVLCGFFFFDRTFQLPLQSVSAAPNPGQSIKILTYNVRLFDLYNWSQNKETRNKIIAFIREEKPDIINFQEFYADDENYLINIDSLKYALGTPYCHTEYTLTLRKKNHWGIATFSRFPVTGKGRVSLGKKSHNLCIYTDIKVNDDTIRVFNMHLQSLHLRNEDYRFMHDLGIDSAEVDEIEGSKKIIKRLKRAYQKRAIQCDSVRAFVERSTHPVILCGDLNDTPVSYAYNRVSTGLSDAFMEAGYGLANTYHGIFPSYRIDYIFYGKEFEATSFKVEKKPFSDHFPVISRLTLRKGKSPER